MELERTPIISIRTGEAVKSVKELKQQISDLKDKIVELRNAEKDCSQETLELQAAQRELNAVNGVTKKDVDAVAGSYNALIKELKEARDEWKQIPQFIDGELNPAYVTARDRVRELTETIGQMEQSTGDWHRNVGNYQSALDGVAGSAGKLQQGMNSLAGTFGIATKAGTPFGKAMDHLKSAIGILQGASGILGLIKGQDKLTVSTKKNTTATITDASAHATNTVAKGTETVATNILQKAVEALKASVSLGFSLLLSFIPDVVSWFERLGTTADTTALSLDNLLGSADRLKTSFDKLKSDDEFQLELMRARKEDEQKIHEQHMENLQKELDKAKENENTADRALLLAQGHLAEAKEGTKEYEKAKEAVDKWTKALQDARDEQVKLNTEIERAPEMYEAKREGEAKTNAENAAKRAAEEAKRASEKAKEEAKKALEEVQKVLDSGLKGVEAITQKYKKANDKLEENIKKSSISENEAEQARRILRLQEAEEIEEFYKKTYTARYKGYEDSLKLQRKEADETKKVYKGLIPELKDSWKERLKLDQENRKITKQRLEEDLLLAKETLKQAVGPNQQDKLSEFLAKSNEDLKGMYHEMLTDSEKFAKDWPEPFREALKTMVPSITGAESEEKDRLEQYVQDLMKAYKDAIEKGKVEDAEEIKKMMLGDPPIAGDEDLTNACNDFIARFAKKLEEAQRKNNPWTKFWSGATQAMETYGKATQDLLDNTADAWEELINLQVDLGKKSDAEAEKSFNNMKALRYASAVIDTAAAVAKAFATAPNYVVGAIQAAAALAAGTAQVLKIANTHYNGSSGGGGSTSAPTALQPTAYVPTVGLNTLDYATDTASAMGNMKVYVLESDISEAQTKVRVRESEATW